MVPESEEVRLCVESAIGHWLVRVCVLPVLCCLVVTFVHLEVIGVDFVLDPSSIHDRSRASDRRGILSLVPIIIVQN